MRNVEAGSNDKVLLKDCYLKVKLEDYRRCSLLLRMLFVIVVL
jgi:hypothetical protein